jgi:hypothetical protein
MLSSSSARWPPRIETGHHPIFENYKGGVLPPAAASERDIVGLGVAEKQTGRARQVFEKSAEQAGYFEHGKTRLVMPAVAAREDAPPPPPDEHVNRDRKGNAETSRTGSRLAR